MSNFNEYFKNTGAKIMVDRFFGKVDEYNTKHKITKLDWEIVEENPRPSSYYLENALTASHKIRITYQVDSDGEDRYSEFEVPKEIDGVFIIEGAYRVATNKLGQDYDCRIKTTGSGEHRVTFDFNRYYDIDRDVLRIRKWNADLGTYDRPTDLKMSNLENWLKDPEKREQLRLTPEQIKKLQVKLDLDWTPEFIDKRIIDACIAFGDDRMKDLIIDKSIDSISQSFMRFLFKDGNGRNFFTTRRRIRDYFNKYDKLQDSINSITMLCTKFWRLGSAELQVPPGVNSINMWSFNSKIQFTDTVAYNQTMADLIDIADTPISQSSGLLNSLTVSTHLTEDGIMFDVWTKDFKKVTIPYIDYLNSKVVASEYVDYERHELKPNESGQVQVKYRMKRKMVPVKEIDLIDLHPDYRLSTTTRRIPFVNYTDSVRISMGDSMLKQSMPLINAQRPLVDTGNYDDLPENLFNERFQYDSGKVKEITGKEIIIELPDKTLVNIPRRTALQSVNDVSVYSEPKVKPGQKVKRGDIIAGAVEVEPDTVKLGLNTNVLFHAYHGLVNEDAVVVSESYADRLATYSIIDLYIDVKSSAALKWIAPIGTQVKAKDKVVILYKAVKLTELNKLITDKLGGLIKDEEGRDISDFTIESGLEVPNNIDSAVVSDVLVQENIKPKIPKNVKEPDYTFSHTSQGVIDEYEKNKDRQVIYDKYPEYIASDTLDPIDMSGKSYKVVYTVRVRLIKYTRAVLGSKITSRYGGKGVISRILPDSQMPIVNGKRIECVLNPFSTVNRKIPSVIMECALGNIAYKLHDEVEKLKRTATGRKKILPLLDKYYEGRYSKMTVEDFLELHETKPIEEVYGFKVGCFSKFTPAKIQKWMEELGVSTQAEVEMPETELTDLDELKANLDPDEYEKTVKEMAGRFIKVEKPLMTGMMTMEHLYHMPQYSNKVTTDMIDTRKQEPIAGRGNYRVGGQSIGEMEVWALLSRGAKTFIEDYRKDAEQELNQRFLDNLLGLGMMVTDDKGYGQGGSNLKDSVNRMRTKYRLKGGME